MAWVVAWVAHGQRAPRLPHLAWRDHADLLERRQLVSISRRRPLCSIRRRWDGLPLRVSRPLLPRRAHLVRARTRVSVRVRVRLGLGFGSDYKP